MAKVTIFIISLPSTGQLGTMGMIFGMYDTARTTEALVVRHTVASLHVRLSTDSQIGSFFLPPLEVVA